MNDSHPLSLDTLPIFGGSIESVIPYHKELPSTRLFSLSDFLVCSLKGI